MVDTGIDEDALEPTLERCQNIRMARFLELMNVFKKFDKSFIHDLFHLFKVILITVTDFYSIILEHVIQLLLACTVIRSTPGNQSMYVRVSCDQFVVRYLNGR